MKKIGLVGGISWTSTLDYYRYINEGINAQLGGLNFAECIVYSVNFDNFQRYNAAYDWEATFSLLANAAANLKKAGAEVIVLGANTAHIVADRIEAQLQLPLINIVTATAAAINKKQLRKVGLLGTSYTMELDFYTSKLRAAGIEPMIPGKQEDRDYIEDKLRHELGAGIINPDTKAGYRSIIQQLIDRGAEGIILAVPKSPYLSSRKMWRCPYLIRQRFMLKQRWHSHWEDNTGTKAIQNKFLIIEIAVLYLLPASGHPAHFIRLLF